MYISKTKNNITVINKTDYDSPPFDNIVGDVCILNYSFVNENEIGYYTKAALEKLPLTKTIYVNYCEEAIHSTYWNIIFELCKTKGYKKIVWTDGGLTEGTLLRHLNDISISHKPSYFSFDRLQHGYKSIIENGVIPRNKHFVSLARMPRVERIYFTGKLLEKNIEDKGIISCGWGDKELFKNNRNLIEEYLVREDLVNKFPIDLGDNDDQQWSNLHNFEKAVYNVVMESGTGYNKTSAESVYNDKDYGWCRSNTDRYFLTEKTTKTFYCRQLPLFIAPAGYVEHLRNLDFDVFDDIIDHNYDKEENIYKRCDMVSDIVSTCTKISLEQLNKILETLEDRFNHNIQRCKELGSLQKETEWINSQII